jgi:hypothetical protein
MPMNDDVVTAVDVANVRAIAEQPAMLANLAFANLVANTNLAQQNAVANQQLMNQLGGAILARAASIATDPPLDKAAVQVITPEDLAKTIADLKATLQAWRPAGEKTA